MTLVKRHTMCACSVYIDQLFYKVTSEILLTMQKTDSIHAAIYVSPVYPSLLITHFTRSHLNLLFSIYSIKQHERKGALA